jgi:hypothetical protein
MVLETLWQTEVQDLIPCVFFFGTEANRRREGGQVGEMARDYGRRTIQTWMTKMTTNFHVVGLL